MPSSADKGIRLNKYISNSGICSRRKADEYIAAGWVEVNGKVIREMGYRVAAGDLVSFKGVPVTPEKKIYLLLNKPKDYITTLRDEKGRKTVMELIKGASDYRLYPVGRLDRKTTGLLLFTNDGELAQKLAHPSSEIEKVYQVTLSKPVTPDDLSAIRKGITLDDGRIRPDRIEQNENEKSEIGIELHSGKNRIVRRIFEHFGYRIRKLDRVVYAGLTKKNLPRGKWRFLTGLEVRQLLRIAQKPGKPDRSESII